MRISIPRGLLLSDTGPKLFPLSVESLSCMRPVMIAICCVSSQKVCYACIAILVFEEISTRSSANTCFVLL